MQNYAQAAGLIPGLYKVRAIFESRGIDTNTYFNPLLGNAKELEGLRPQDWKGLIRSNELTIRIVARRQVLPSVRADTDFARPPWLALATV